MRAALLVLLALAATSPHAEATSAAPLEKTGTLLVPTFGSGQLLANAVNGRTGLEGEVYAVIDGVRAGRDYFVLAQGPHAVFEVVFTCQSDVGPPKQAGVVPCGGTALVFMVVGEPSSGYYYLEA